MKKFILIFLLLSPITLASADEGPFASAMQAPSGVIAGMQSVAALNHQELENQRLEEENQYYAEEMHEKYPSVQPVGGGLIGFIANRISSSRQEQAARQTEAPSISSTDQSLQLISSSYKLHKHTLDIFVDQQKVIAMIPVVQNDGLYGTGVTQQFLYDHPVTTSSANALWATRIIIPFIYSNYDSLNKIDVNVYLLQPDIYGNSEKKLLFSFEINRFLTNKINWQKYNLLDSSKIFPHFKLSNWARNAVSIKNE